MADYFSPVPLSSSPGYDTESVSLDYDYHNDQEQHSDHHPHIPHQDSESEGDLFVPAHRRSPSLASIITLSASESEDNLDAALIEQALPEREIYPPYAEIDLISSTDSGGEEEGNEGEGGGNQDYPVSPQIVAALDFFGLRAPDPDELDSEEFNDLFDDDFDATDEDDFDDAEVDADLDPERVSPLHHHHHHHHHFHPPRLPPIHPDRLPPIVLGVNPLQQLGPRLNFSPPQLHPPFGPGGDRMERAARARNAGHAQQRDELVGVEVERRGNGSSGIASGRNMRGRPLHNQPAPADVIDLTGDDGEVEIVGGSQNVRRQQSQRRDNAPRLNRSDSNYMGNPAVIDISSDSEDDILNRANAGGTPAAPHRHHHHHHHHHHHPRNHRAAMDRRSTPRRDPQPPPGNRFFGQQVADFFGNFPLGNLIGIGGRGRDPDVVVVERPNDGQGFNNMVPLPALPFQLNYAHHPFQHHGAPAGAPASPPKPKHEPPAPAKDGFTRDTCEDQILICPSCEEELAYDPDEEEDNGPPTKKQRTKKDKAEHHFWAVKECGHVSSSRQILFPTHFLSHVPAQFTDNFATRRSIARNAMTTVDPRPKARSRLASDRLPRK